MVSLVSGDVMLVPNLKSAKERTKRVPLIKNYIIDVEYKTIGKGKTYHIKTYGCQMNEHDSENIKAILEEMGFTYNSVMEESDLILLNTCAIRENAHNKVFGMLGRLKHLKEERKDIIVGLCGCMAQEESVVEEITNKFKWMDLVFGTHNIHELPKILKTSLDKNKLEVEVLSYEGDIIEDIPVKRDSKYKAWVNIMYGCDKFCTYCIVPYTRGKQRSRYMDEILKEVRELKEQGYKEITLLGQNVNAYGKDIDDSYDFATLLEECAKIGIPRIRFTTSHPWDFSDEMLDVIGKYENIMPFIHLPLQSGDSDILKLMGRRYTQEEYITLYNKIIERIPNVAVSTDIIVGFPNESDQQFEHTLDVVKYCKFDNAFTFIFSPRPGTPASRMEDPISLETKKKRLALLNKTWNQYALERNKAYIGKTVTVLVDGWSKKNHTVYSGYTDTNKLVNFTGNHIQTGDFVQVYIDDAKTFSLDGHAIE